jgi:hypothetical protein
MTTWTYEASGGLNYPVERGDIWQVGEHVYACLDFMSTDGHQRVQELLAVYPPTLLYADPPWNQGNVNAFRTKAGLARADYHWVGLYRRVVDYVPAHLPVWLESGQRERPRVLSDVLHRHHNVTVYDVTYNFSKPLPSLVYYAGPDPSPVDVTGMEDLKIPGKVLTAYPVGRVFDPCAGLGGTAKWAARLGWASLNIELSPHRVSAGLSAIAAILHAQPERISDLTPPEGSPAMTVSQDFTLTDDQRRDPVVWIEQAPEEVFPLIAALDLSDEAMHRYLGTGGARGLKSFGHDKDGVHFLLTRAGTTLHTDKGYARYSHQLVLRNDGNRLRGLERYDNPRAHPPLVPGTMYALDTHSPHQGTADRRFAVRRTGMKAVLAADRDTLLNAAQVWELFSPWLHEGRQFADVDYDPSLKSAPFWKDTSSG